MKFKASIIPKINSKTFWALSAFLDLLNLCLLRGMSSVEELHDGHDRTGETDQHESFEIFQYLPRRKEREMFNISFKTL